MPSARVVALLGSGALRLHIGGGSTPGERGSGYSLATADNHIEPDEIYVLGTSHVSAQSAEDVQMVIDELTPDCVVLELCRSRSGLLYADDDAAARDRGRSLFGISGDGGPLQALLRSLSLGGWQAMMLRVGLVRVSSKVGLQAGVLPGADLRAARRAALGMNSTLVLGDRPLEITLERCWDALPTAERWVLLRLGWFALRGGVRGEASTADVDEGVTALVDRAVDDASALQGLEAVLAERLPSLVKPLVTERDVYLSLSMRSSLAVSGKRRVLGVVGRGHVDGVMDALARPDEHRGAFKQLTWTPRRAAAKRKLLGVIPEPLAKRLLLDGALGLALWTAIC